ncbi:hypothetical protein Tco_0710414, partial [Tanacetum coccineum]
WKSFLLNTLVSLFHKKRLSVNNCRSLLDKIKSRVLNWKNKCLSYAGRLQLIASVLESIHVYWASVFLLPKTVIHDINKVLKSFLWSQGELSKGKAKVAWANICRPKTMGGLRLKESIWAINEEVNDSWSWKNILRLRDEARNRNMYNARRGEGMVVKDIVENGTCMWPMEWIVKYPALLMHQMIQLDSNKDDHLIWRSKNRNDRKFSVGQAYQDLCCNDESGKVKDKMEISNDSRNWTDIVKDFSTMYCGNSINSIIRRLCLAAYVYLIWPERNCRIFRNERRNVEGIFDSFTEIIRMRLLTLKAKKSQDVIKAQKKWNVSLICPNEDLI